MRGRLDEEAALDRLGHVGGNITTFLPNLAE
jgi:hypothetical protein